MPPGGGMKRWGKAVQRRLPPAAQERVGELAQRLRARAEEPEPPALLSVVMPVFNVAPYVEDAAGSVLAQSHGELELILVDDGSTDGSAELCDELARRDPRVRVIHTGANTGPGAARNVALETVRGEYLAFADSDDHVPPGTYELMLKTLRESGSDLVTGNVHRKKGDHEYQAWNQSHSHGTSRTGIRLGDLPELLFDTVIWNKIYRTEFWRAHVKTFPERKLYEDTWPMFLALSNARALDVLADVVYIWRVRPSGGSITQRLLEPNNIGDRFEMIDRIDDALAGSEHREQLTENLIRKVLEGDLWIYVPELGQHAPPEVVARVEAAARRYWPRASAANRALVSAQRRVAYWLLAQGRAGDVPAFLDWYQGVQRALPIRRDGAALALDVADCPVDLSGIEPDALDAASLAEGVAAVTAVRWTGPTTLAVEGYAYSRFVSAGDQQIALVAAHADTGARVTLPAERTASVEAALRATDVASAHDRDGFSCAFDVGALAAEQPRGAWVLSAHVVDGPIERTAALSRITRSGSAAVVGTTVLPDGTLVQVDAMEAPALTIRLDRVGVVGGACEIDGDRVTVVLADPQIEGSELWFASPDARVAADRTAPNTFTAQLPPPKARAKTWRVLTRVAGTQQPVVAAASLTAHSTPNGSGFRAAVTRAGRLLVEAQRTLAIVDDVTVGDSGEIVVSGSLIGLDALDVGLAPGDGPPSAWQAATVEGGRFRATVPTRQPDRSGEPRPLRTGGYRLHARDTDLVLSAAGSTALPFTHLDDTAKLTFTRRARGRLGVEVAGPVPDELLSRYAQERLIEKFATTPRRLEEAVFFVVDLGSNTGDSALALHEELRRRGSSLRLYWGIDDRSVVVPDGGIPIVKFSVDWFAKLNASRYVVNNYGGVWGLEKDPEQRYLQTWHGTPLKYIGASEARQTNAPESRLDVIARESSAWDALISPSPYFTELARTEFRYEGPVLETGYPRNDRLANATSDDVAKLRATFALPTAAKVVLYAPTYRDDQRHGWKADLFEGLDLDRLLEQLGPDWRVLLRGHSFSARADHVDRSGGRILDVTRHPDVNDLYLVADLLVTDYSSVMFDYSVTGKPMAFFVPDLEQYAATRGMYFDLAECAPGPLCTDVDGLAGEVRDLGALAERYREKYAAFRQRFAPWDDGKAAARVVDQFF